MTYVPDPVYDLIFLAKQAGGCDTVVLSTPTVADSLAYNPNTPATFAGAAPTTATVDGIWYDEVTEFNDQRIVAAFLITAASKPANLQADLTRAIRGSMSYTVLKFQERRYAGRINGYLLGLGV